MSIVLRFVAVFTAAINLRAGMASIGAVLDDVVAHYGAPASLGGVITAMPGAMFCIFGLAAVPLARRVGLSPTLLAAGVATAAGLLLRPFAPLMSLFILGTVSVAGGIAMVNVLLPAWIKKYGGRHMVAMTATYSVALSLSAALGPLSALFTDSWQVALGAWASTALLQVAVWAVVVGRAGDDRPEQTGAAGAAGMHRSPTALALMVFFGLQSMNAYVQMGWLPSMLTEQGVSASTATLGLALIGLLGAGGGLLLPAAVARIRTLTPLVIAFGLASAAGYVGILVAAEAAPIVWCVLLGLGGWCFPLALALMPARTRTVLGTARLSGFVQPVGYVLAAAGPLLVGVAYGQLGSFGPILVVLAALSLVMGALGIVASRRVFIEDELAGNE
ncbi:MFS transporter, CP family, cyanate transporter [Corynebacterium mycetoides]|uniref:MFS transporter, CP family, cyanate transporter n=1 Tax=Corynebacterium mycetoides TaxID=38302 RepID=A0A1G9LFI6_9CORY|nr:MFS transporter [Corynebacterium mycetoides]SDL60646.1 MFS transporter, CP family, cyanate transporter [Corynebacterium mycetoides]